MKVKLITENDEAVSAVISCNPEELLIINKALSRAYADESFGERSRNIAKQMGEDCKHFEQAECPWDDLFVINVNDYCSKGQRKEDGE